MMQNQVHLQLRRILTVPLSLWWWSSESSHVASGGLRLISSCNGELGVPLKLQHGNHIASWIEVGNSGFPLSCGRILRVSLELQQGTQSSFRVGVDTRGSFHSEVGNSVFVSSWGDSEFLSIFSGASSHVVLRQLVSSRDVLGGSFFFFFCNIGVATH